MIFNSPKKQLEKSIIEIKEGRGNQKVVGSSIKVLIDHPELMEDAVHQLVGIIQTDEVENFTYVIEVMSNISQVEPELLVNSSDAITRILEFPENNLDTKCILKTMDILSKTASSRPECIELSVRTLIHKMNSSNIQIRSASFYILDIIVKSHPEYFLNCTWDLFGSFHSPHSDEQLYATKLIIDISTISHSGFGVFCKMINELVHNCSDRIILQEAYDAIKDFEVDENLLKPEKDISPSNDKYRELNEDLEESIKGIDFEESAAEMLKTLGMDHLIVKPKSK